MRWSSAFCSSKRQDCYPHKNNPEVLFLSLAFPAQSASKYPAKTSFVSLLYHTPKSAMVLTYFMILFKTIIWNFGISLISNTHSYTVTNVRSTSSKVKKIIYHSSIKRRINTFTQQINSEFNIWAHRGSNRTSIFQTKIFHKIFSIFKLR